MVIKEMINLPSSFPLIIKRNINAMINHIAFIQIQVMVPLLGMEKIFILLTIVTKIIIATVIFHTPMVLEKSQNNKVKATQGLVEIITFM